MTSTTTQNLHGIWGTGPGDVWAVGDNSTVLRYSNGKWPPTLPTTEHLYAVWSSGGQVYAVGEAGLVIHHDGSKWITETAGKSKLTGVFSWPRPHLFWSRRGRCRPCCTCPAGRCR